MNSVTSNTRKPNKQELLAELESIRSSLGQPETGSNADSDPGEITHREDGELSAADAESALKEAYRIAASLNESASITSDTVQFEAIAFDDDEDEDELNTLIVDDTGEIELDLTHLSDGVSEPTADEKANEPVEAEVLEDELPVLDTPLDVQELPSIEKDGEEEDEDIEHKDAHNDLTDHPTEQEEKEDTDNMKPLPGQRSLFDDSVYDDDNLSGKNQPLDFSSAENKESADSLLVETENSLDKGTKTPEEVQLALGDDFSPDTDLEDTESSLSLPKAAGENPFLPQRIKERLAQQKTNLERDLEASRRQLEGAITDSSESAINEESTDTASTAIDALVDELVAQYLPKIEAELRIKLRNKLSDK